MREKSRCPYLLKQSPAAIVLAFFDRMGECPFQYEFCDILVLYGRKPRTKAPGQILAELDRLVMNCKELRRDKLSSSWSHYKTEILSQQVNLFLQLHNHLNLEVCALGPRLNALPQA